MTAKSLADLTDAELDIFFAVNEILVKTDSHATLKVLIEHLASHIGASRDEVYRVLVSAFGSFN